MKVLVVNSGSSSLKCTLFGMPEREALAHCVVERIGEDEPAISIEANGAEEAGPCTAEDHEQALDAALRALLESRGGALKALEEIGAVGHRVVHGGEEMSGSAVVTEEVMAVIRRNSVLAPLHNPANLVGLEAAAGRLPHTPQVAVFDTAFHGTMPPAAYLYGLPYELYEQHGIRRYGFHGTSHAYVAERAAEVLGVPFDGCSLITLHLGNGCSACAVRNGRSVDTSMGMTPLEGLVMGTRCGDVDPALFFLLTRELDMAPADVYDLLNRQSGLQGLSGKTNDMREILADAEEGDARARAALEVFCYRVRKYIGAYLAVLGGADAVVFTAGIGENCPLVRRMVCQGLEPLGIRLDGARNEAAVGREATISEDGSPVTVLVVPTDEELRIAIETHRLCRGP
jgi:acetate kinase